jgi:hypothetical protein
MEENIIRTIYEHSYPWTSCHNNKPSQNGRNHVTAHTKDTPLNPYLAYSIQRPQQQQQQQQQQEEFMRYHTPLPQMGR